MYRSKTNIYRNSAIPYLSKWVNQADIGQKENLGKLSTNVKDTASKIEVKYDLCFSLYFLPLSLKGCYVKRKGWWHKFYRMGETKKSKIWMRTKIINQCPYH